MDFYLSKPSLGYKLVPNYLKVGASRTSPLSQTELDTFQLEG